MVKLAIIGSRGFSDYPTLCKFISENIEIAEIECIISGGAIGADYLGYCFSQDNNIPFIEIKPDWNKYGKSAGFIRNHEIIKSCDICFAFWDGKSKGTKHDIDLCTKYEKPLKLFNYGNN